MSFLNILTLAFIVLKLTEVINWSWWYVLAPSIFQVVLTLVVIILAVIRETNRDKRFDDWRNK